MFAQRGPVRVIAANGPASLQAHDGELELLADQAITITATDYRIDVLAQSKVVLQAGSSSITLEGGDITFSCLREFTVKAGDHPFLGGSNSSVPMPALPKQLLTRDPFEIRIALKKETGEVIAKQAIRVFRADGGYEDAVTGEDGSTAIIARSDKSEHLQVVLADNEDWEVDDPDVTPLAAAEDCCARAMLQTEGTQG